MTLSAQEIVDAEIAQHKIVVFSKQWCGFCKRAKDTLNEKVGRDNYRIYELEDENNEPLTPEGLEPSDFQNYFKQMVGTRSVPKVPIGSDFWWEGDILCWNTIIADKDKKRSRFDFSARILIKLWGFQLLGFLVT